MAYATVSDVEARTTRTFTEEQEAVISTLLDDAAVMIDAFAQNASADAKQVVSCRMVLRAVEDGEGVPLGATQGSMSALGYSQSWTIGSSGATGELYLGKIEKQLLGKGNQIGSHSPVEDQVVTCCHD
ncbi:MAG: hypothetical protein IKG25_04155 [Mogibacterium sp.]|nr:hypothetical protein [Mogibacterium sp.]